MEQQWLLALSGHQAAAYEFSGHLLLGSDRKQHNYSLKLEGNCEHLRSAFLFNTCLECLSERVGKASWIEMVGGSVAGLG